MRTQSYRTRESAFLYHQRREKNPTMAEKSDKDLGINSWLEDELYQEYLHDRAAVDESWKHVFDDARGANGRASAPVAAESAVPSTEKPAGGQPPLPTPGQATPPPAPPSA